MSKFVTYGATETLDNDQKFIIDSNRTGPGSITAKDAASSLLSKWAGFDTFEEAVQNTISNNQEFIDRGAAIRSETAELKKKIVTTFPAKDASGAVATFDSEFEDAPLKSCIVQIEPVQEGSGDPSPDNVRPISGWTGCEVQRTGKNLLPLNIWSGFNYNASVGKVFTPTVSDKSWTQDESSITYETTATYTTMSLMTPLLHKGTYHLGLHKLSTNSLRYSRYTLDKSFTVKQSDYISNVTNVSVAITLDEDGYIAFYLDNGSTASQTVEITIQVEVGNTESTYEPYKGQTYPVAFPTEAGTVYGAYVDVTGGELVVDTGFATLNGSETWREYPSYNGFYTDAVNMKYGVRQDGISNMLINSKTGNSGQTNAMWLGVNSARLFVIGVYDSMGSTLDEFKAYLAEHPLQVTYPLATPIHYPLTPTEITSLLGQNNIWSDTGDTAVEYLMSDVSWYVEKKLRAFQSILAGVEDSTSASKNYSANTYLIFNNDIYRVTKAITAGETIEEGVNVTKTTVAEQLMALAQA